MTDTLRLHLKRVYWEQIRDGQKLEEYRLATPYWSRRLREREYDRIELLLGYPKRGDTSRTIVRAWKGCEVRHIIHEHFGPYSVKVFAINVSAPEDLTT